MAGGERIHSREDIAQKNGNSFWLQQAGFVFIDGVLKAFVFLMAFYQIMYITLAGDGLNQCFFF
jgi:hypothetical protein